VADRAERDDIHPVGELTREPCCIRPPDDAGNECVPLTRLLPEREVTVTRGVVLVIGDLSPDPDVVETGIIQE
jgi:hypothetical protein